MTAVLQRIADQPQKAPKTITVRLTADEVRRLAVAFQPHHLTPTPTGVRVHVGRIVRDLYDGDPHALASAWKHRAQVPATHTRQDHAARVQHLIDHTRNLPAHAARERLLADLEQGRGWAPSALRRNGLDAARVAVENYLTILHRLPLQQPTRLRTLSANLLRGSKLLDPGTDLYARVADALRNGLPRTDETVADQRRRAFEEANVFQNLTGVSVLVYGPLHLQYAAEEDDHVARNSQRGQPTILSLAELVVAQVTGPVPPWILTVENETPFNEFLGRGPPAGIIVCTGGYPNRAVSKLLNDPRLAPVPLHHWGDTDPDGFAILEEIRPAHTVTPLLMDADAIQQHASQLTPFADGQRARFDTASHRHVGWTRHALDACLRLGGFLEQESVSPTTALKALTTKTPRVSS